MKKNSNYRPHKSALAIRFGRYLRRIRKARGLSLREFGRAANMPFNSVAQLEYGLYAPRLNDLQKLAEAFGQSTPDFVREFYGG